MVWPCRYTRPSERVAALCGCGERRPARRPVMPSTMVQWMSDRGLQKGGGVVYINPGILLSAVLGGACVLAEGLSVCLRLS